MTREAVAQWFELDRDSPYMLLAAKVLSDRLIPVPEEARRLVGIDKLEVPRSKIPAVTHVDNSACIQTVSAETNPRFHALLEAFERRTGCPILINASFNVRGEPLVCTPEDAYQCFMGTDIETLAIGNALLRSEDQPERLKRQYHAAFALD